MGQPVLSQQKKTVSPPMALTHGWVIKAMPAARPSLSWPWPHLSATWALSGLTRRLPYRGLCTRGDSTNYFSLFQCPVFQERWSGLYFLCLLCDVQSWFYLAVYRQVMQKLAFFSVFFRMLTRATSAVWRLGPRELSLKTISEASSTGRWQWSHALSLVLSAHSVLTANLRSSICSYPHLTQEQRGQAHAQVSSRVAQTLAIWLQHPWTSPPHSTAVEEPWKFIYIFEL